MDVSSRHRKPGKVGNNSIQMLSFCNLPAGWVLIISGPCRGQGIEVLCSSHSTADVRFCRRWVGGCEPSSGFWFGWKARDMITLARASRWFCRDFFLLRFRRWPEDGHEPGDQEAYDTAQQHFANAPDAQLDPGELGVLF